MFCRPLFSDLVSTPYLSARDMCSIVAHTTNLILASMSGCNLVRLFKHKTCCRKVASVLALILLCNERCSERNQSLCCCSTWESSSSTKAYSQILPIPLGQLCLPSGCGPTGVLPTFSDCPDIGNATPTGRMWRCMHRSGVF